MLDAIRARPDPWLGAPTRDQASSSVTLLYRFDSKIPPVRRLRLKIEINTREHFSVYDYLKRAFDSLRRWGVVQGESITTSTGALVFTMAGSSLSVR